MTDIVNDFLRKYYPADAFTAWEMRSLGSDYGREYTGDRNANSRIFPEMECADGFKMSVQGHFGAYSYPRDDFAESYSQFEIMSKAEPVLEALGRGYDVGEYRIYPYVPLEAVLRVIESHGGLAK
jgi:hypothetical protein